MHDSRRRRWKLIRYLEIDRTQLFDLQNDPHEMTNLADRPEQATRVRAMTAALLAEMKRNDNSLASLTVAQTLPAAFDPKSLGASQAAKKKKS